MKLGVLVCLLALTLSVVGATPEPAAFEKARTLGSFFLFSTSHGKYTIRNDGMGEISNKKTHLFFYMKVARGGWLKQIYFQEYQGDLLLLYEVNNGRGYLARMNPQTRWRRWLAAVDADKIESCVVADGTVSCGPPDDLTTIDLKNGAEIKKTSSQSSSSTSSPNRGAAFSASAREYRKAA